MNTTLRLLASTALAISVGAVPAQALPAGGLKAVAVPEAHSLVIRVQASVSEAQRELEEAMAALAEAQSSDGDVEAAKQRVEAAQAQLDEALKAEADAPAPEPEIDPEILPQTETEPPAEEPAAPEAPPAEEPQEAPAPDETVAPEEAPVAEEAPAPEEIPVPEEAPDQEPPAEAPPAEEEAPETPAEETVPEEAPAPEEIPVPEEAPDQEPPAEAPAAEEEAPAEETAPESEATETPEELVTPPATEEIPAPEEAPEAEVPAEALTPPAAEDDAATEEAPAAEDAPATQELPAEGAAPAGEPAPTDTAPTATEQDATDGVTLPSADEAEPAAQSGEAEEGTPEEQEAEARAAAEAAAESDIEVTPEATLPVEDGAPVLDSAKEAPAPATTEEGQAAPDAEAPAEAPAEDPAEGQTEETTETAPDTAAEAPAEQVAAPTTDQEAQSSFTVEMQAAPPSATEERGERLQAAPTFQIVPDNAQVIEEVNNTFIFQFNNQTIIENRGDRLTRRARDVYYEELPRGRVREVVVRRDGVEVVTIRNRYGEIIQRTKYYPDGREVLLAYVPDWEREERRSYYDAGRDLPPMVLEIPIREYILDATLAEPEDYYVFLDQPPVERVERVYSVSEVQHSARIRDKVRRIDMDTLTFEFGSSDIPRDQVDDLQSLADAMARILEEDPSETFLIEGHTDAVGTDQANLILSDERAESVAVALAEVYAIPSENLVTQGYGERYLKVRTEAPERLNRRVTVRRITPLVKPVVASNQQ